MAGPMGLLRRRQIDAIAPEPLGAERRRNMRMTTVFQVAKLITGAFEELCILRDISPEGLKAEIYRAVPVGEQVTIEFRTGHTVSGEVMWAHDHCIGVQFAEEVSVVRILSHSSFDDRIGRIRPPRLRVALTGKMRAGLEMVPITTCDLSQAGLKVEIDRELRADQRCDVSLPGLDRRAVVRWQREGTAGLMFAEALTYPEFAQWRLRLAALEARVAAS